MKTEQQGQKDYSIFCFFALLVPMTEAFLGQNWKGTLVVACAAALLLAGVSYLENPKNGWLSFLRVIALVMITADLLKTTSTSWPGKWTEWIVPLVLLALAMITAGKGTAKAITSVNVLRYGVYAVLGILAVSSAINWKTENAIQGFRMPKISSAVVLLLPSIGREKKRKTYALYILPVVTAILTGEIAAESIYQYSKQLSIKGITEHIESIAACATTLGEYALIVYLLDCAQKEWEYTSWKENPWFLSVFGAAVYAVMFLSTEIRAEAQVIMLLILWYAVPTAIKIKDLNFLKKVLDK